ncbi:flavodoxin family protein [Peptoniphilus sp. EMRHCC_23]|uniref:flavodoxin family protein n=1 Tax=Peptoniphilus rachelemmaiella TaxID=2811779 RepID=UPI001C004041|nr:flavodoxin family protein [Peptoniphilus rachelemmaiella]
MKLLILFASPRPKGNTAQLLDKITKRFDDSVEVARFDLYKMNLKSCIACLRCQKVSDGFNCVHDDDMQKIFDAALQSDLILFATPIYSFYCTPPMKMVLDRLVYGMCKYYGETMGPSLWAGKSIALVSTFGYPEEKASDLLTEGLVRYAKHNKLSFLGAYGERQRSYKEPFMNEAVDKRAEAFADKLMAFGESLN